MKGSHPRPADRCPSVLRHGISQVTSFMQLGMLWNGCHMHFEIMNFFQKNICNQILLLISLKFVPKGPVERDTTLPLVWCCQALTLCRYIMPYGVTQPTMNSKPKASKTAIIRYPKTLVLNCSSFWFFFLKKEKIIARKDYSLRLCLTLGH